MFISTGQASAGGRGTSNALSNSMATLLLVPLLEFLFGGCLRHTAIDFRPAGGVVQELLDLGKLGRIELAAGLGELEHVPPRAQMMQLDVEVGEDLLAIRIDAVIEDDEDVLDRGAGGPQRIAEVDLAAAVGGQVFDQQHALAGFQVTLDLGVPAE